MLFDFKTYIRVIYLTLVKRKPSWQRLLIVIFIVTIYPLLIFLDRLGMALDYLLFPRFRKEKIEKPVFIIGNFRTGTTHLHRLMAQDRDVFYTFTIYDILLTSLFWRRIFDAIYRLDQTRFKGVLTRLMYRLNETGVSHMDHMHVLRWNEPDEDEWIFGHTFSTPLLFGLFPFMKEMEDLARFDLWPPSKKQRMLRFYENCLKRHAYHNGKGRIFLSKNPAFTMKLLSLHEYFPDARFIYCIRPPHETISSMLNYVYIQWQTHTPEITKHSEEVKLLTAWAIDLLKYAHENQTKIPPHQFHTVNYVDLVQNPKETIEHVYRFLNLPIRETYAQKLTQESEKAKHYRSRHQHVGQDYDLDHDSIYETLKDIYLDFGYEKPEGVARSSTAS